MGAALRVSQCTCSPCAISIHKSCMVFLSPCMCLVLSAKYALECWCLLCCVYGMLVVCLPRRRVCYFPCVAHFRNALWICRVQIILLRVVGLILFSEIPHCRWMTKSKAK